MPEVISRREYLKQKYSARAAGALRAAEQAQAQVTRDPWMPAQDSLNGKHVVIIGSGVGGPKTSIPASTARRGKPRWCASNIRLVTLNPI